MEDGYPKLANDIYVSFWGPAKTPASIVKKLADAVAKALEDKEVRKKIGYIAQTPNPLPLSIYDNIPTVQKSMELEIKSG
jgi:ABC-type phosphate transport system ATPase subunit